MQCQRSLWQKLPGSGHPKLKHAGCPAGRGMDPMWAGGQHLPRALSRYEVPYGTPSCILEVKTTLFWGRSSSSERPRPARSDSLVLDSALTSANCSLGAGIVQHGELLSQMDANLGPYARRQCGSAFFGELPCLSLPVSNDKTHLGRVRLPGCLPACISSNALNCQYKVSSPRVAHFRRVPS